MEPDHWFSWARPGTIELQFEGELTVLCLRGEIDRLVVDRFEQDHRPQLGALDTIDAGSVTFISSAGIQLMRRWRNASFAGGRPAVLRSSSPSVDRLLRLTGLVEIFARPGIDLTN